MGDRSRLKVVRSTVHDRSSGSRVSAALVVGTSDFSVTTPLLTQGEEQLGERRRRLLAGLVPGSDESALPETSVGPHCKEGIADVTERGPPFDRRRVPVVRAPEVTSDDGAVVVVTG